MFPRQFLAAAVLAAAASSAFAQLFGATIDPDWKESGAPPPPALKTTGLVALDIPRSALRFGIDPASISIGEDRVVRYVVVALGDGGAVNGIYEGLHCNTGKVKVYARNAGAGWVAVQDSEWKAVHDAPHATYTLPIARGGACSGHAPNRSAAQIIRDLRAPVDSRFATETR